MENRESYASEIEQMGAAHAVAIQTSDISFEVSFRDACEKNYCGYYNRCWTCPPDAGKIEDLIARIRSYSNAVVFQTISPLEDSYDIEGMHDAAVAHNKLTLRIQQNWREIEPGSMVLGAGACGVCTECTKPKGLPCRFPDKAITSIEACGVDASALAKTCGLRYINGQNTVTYFGILLY